MSSVVWIVWSVVTGAATLATRQPWACADLDVPEHLWNGTSRTSGCSVPMGTLHQCDSAYPFLLCLFFVLHYSPASTVLEHSWSRDWLFNASTALSASTFFYQLPLASTTICPRDGTWLYCLLFISAGEGCCGYHNLTLLRPFVFRSSTAPVPPSPIRLSILSASLSLYTSIDPYLSPCSVPLAFDCAPCL